MIELRAGRLRCELEPGLGGAVAGLWLDDAPVLRSTPAAALTSVRQAACQPLVPFSNRVGHAAVRWTGTLQPEVRHTGDAPHAIHGVGGQRPWSVLDEGATGAMLAYEHRPDASWPFAFDCSHTLRLAPEALELTLALTNQSGQPAPASLGWRVALAQVAGSRLAFGATGRWECDADRLPGRRLASGGLDADPATLVLDDCFDGWNGLAEWHAGGAKVRLRSGLSHLVVAAGVGEDALLLQPASHVPNAVHLYAGGKSAADLGLALLQPGESLLAQLRIEVEGPA